MRQSDQTATTALDAAQAFVDRYNDVTSCAAADDIAQQTALTAWLRRDTVRAPEKIGAFARTIAKRLRARAVAASLRRPMESLDADPKMAKLLLDEPTPPEELLIGGHRVPVHWCLRELDRILPQLGALNRSIVLSYYEGFSCVELAERYRVPVDVVKVRLHRCRARIRKAFHRRMSAMPE